MEITETEAEAVKILPRGSASASRRGGASRQHHITAVCFHKIISQSLLELLIKHWLIDHNVGILIVQGLLGTALTTCVDFTWL